MPQSAANRWVLLIHQIPPKPDYFRVKVWRRLQRLGAVAIKNSVYVLPRSDETVEDLQWQMREIVAGGGEASVCEANFVDGLTDTEIEALFRTAREGVYVDRIASAWLIRRFIDSKARFKFVAAEGYRPRRGELRFDMFEAEYTHEGDACTFETLVARFGLGDRAFRVIAEIVHDIDCKEAKFGRPEASGIERLIAGIAKQHAEDGARLASGTALFDALHAALAATAAGTGAARKPKRSSRR